MKGIELRNVTKIFSGKTCALNNVNLCFESGKIYGLLGRNGAGKSTLLNIISNRLFATSGDVYIDGELSKENDKALSKVYCISELDLFPNNYSFKYVMKITSGFYPNFDMEYAQNLASKFNLDIKKKLKSLSTGYNSISKIILALSCNAEYVFLDEPILGLDANHRELFYKELLAKYIENGGTYIISTHLIEECANLIEKAVIIKNGEIIENADTEELLSTAYVITGSQSEVDKYCDNKKVLGFDTMGGLKSAYIQGIPVNVSNKLEVSKMNLQNLFIQLTNK